MFVTSQLIKILSFMNQIVKKEINISLICSVSLKYILDKN